jgi:hypothetical protein
MDVSGALRTKVQVSSSSGTFTTSSTGYVDITNLNLQVTNYNGLVMLFLQYGSSNSYIWVDKNQSAATAISGEVRFRIVRDATVITESSVFTELISTSDTFTSIGLLAPLPLLTMDVVGGGSYLYKVQVKGFSSASVDVKDVSLVSVCF